MEEKRKELIERLLSQTRSKKIQWEEIHDDSYRAPVGTGLVRIEFEVKGGRDDDDHYFEIKKLNVWVIRNGGAIADSFSRSFGSLEQDLFDAARHSATNANSVYDEMLSALVGK